MEPHKLKEEIKMIKGGFGCIFKLSTVYGNFYMDSKCLMGRSQLLMRDGVYYLELMEANASTREENTRKSMEETLPKRLTMDSIKSIKFPITDEEELKKIEKLLEGEKATLVREEQTYPRIINPNLNFGDIVWMNIPYENKNPSLTSKKKFYKVIGTDLNNKTFTVVRVNKFLIKPKELPYNTVVYVTANDEDKITIPFSKLPMDTPTPSFKYRALTITSMAINLHHKEMQTHIAKWIFKTAQNYKNKS